MWTVLVISPDDEWLQAWDCVDRDEAVRRYDVAVRLELAESGNSAVVIWAPDGTEVDR